MLATIRLKSEDTDYALIGAIPVDAPGHHIHLWQTVM